jgi:hypothetical protein
MSVYEESVAAATAVLGYDIFQNATYKTSANDRVIRGFSVTGSAAVGDSKVSLRVGQLEVAAKYNGKLLFANKDDLIPVGARIPKGMPVSCIVTDAAATHPLNIMIDIV